MEFWSQNSNFGAGFIFSVAAASIVMIQRKYDEAKKGKLNA
jgi:hypothetical protein